MTNAIAFRSVLDWVNLVSGLFSVAGILVIAIQLKNVLERDVTEMRPFVQVWLQKSTLNLDALEIPVVNARRRSTFNVLGKSFLRCRVAVPL